MIKLIETIILETMWYGPQTINQELELCKVSNFLVYFATLNLKVLNWKLFLRHFTKEVRARDADVDTLYEEYLEDFSNFKTNCDVNYEKWFRDQYSTYSVRTTRVSQVWLFWITIKSNFEKFRNPLSELRSGLASYWLQWFLHSIRKFSTSIR